MSNPESKIKHSKRIKEKVNTIKDKIKLAKIFGFDHVLNKIHKYHKSSMFRCASKHCMMCRNPRKVWGEKTMQEKRLELREKDD